MQDTAGEVETKSKVTYSCGPLHIDEQMQDNQQEPTYNSSMPMNVREVGRRGSARSAQVAQHHDDIILSLNYLTIVTSLKLQFSTEPLQYDFISFL